MMNKLISTLILILFLPAAAFSLTVQNLNEDMTDRIVLDRYFYGQTPVDVVGYAGEVDGEMRYAIAQIAQTDPIIALTYAFEKDGLIMVSILNTEEGTWEFREASPANAQLIQGLLDNFRSLLQGDDKVDTE
jgi:hypothetical protein